ncbi:MAG: hypothetical protein IPM77_10335 [Crocinitomicaceae bacterium]|nr:hypothetical protein [Crocinitomicaceae bacterium]
MDATIFGIGIYRPQTNDLFFSGVMEKNERLGDYAYAVTEEKLQRVVSIILKRSSSMTGIKNLPNM